VQGQHDEELWDELISNSLHSPELVGALLERIGRYTDPLGLIKRLPPGMDIPQLRDRLVQIVAAYRTQASLRHGCNAILRADCAALSGACMRSLLLLHCIATASSLASAKEPGETPVDASVSPGRWGDGEYHAT
jgi:hypothetical protein